MNKTLVERYQDLPKSPIEPSPRQALINELVALTGKSESTVRAYVAGSREPDSMTKSQIAAFFDCSTEDLFPTK